MPSDEQGSTQTRRARNPREHTICVAVVPSPGSFLGSLWFLRTSPSRAPQPGGGTGSDAPLASKAHKRCWAPDSRKRFILS